jgi:hypothetical protein
MKYYETHFEEYIHAVDQYNIHPEMLPLYDLFPSSLSQFGNIIIYGPPGSGKYSQVLYFLKKYSPSELKYDKKITCQTDKVDYSYHISDIHYEIDMALLGCNSKMLWHEIFMQIVDIVTVKSEKIGIIVCKNFHIIHNELLEIFYSYMQQYIQPSNHIQIKFILISEHVSFIPKNIMQSCKLISIRRPDKQKYIQRILDIDIQLADNTLSSFLTRINPQLYKKPIDNDSIESNKLSNTAVIRSGILTKSKQKIKSILDCLEPEYIINIKETESFSLMENGSEIPKDNFNTICNNIIQELLQYRNLSFTKFRDIIYDILVYNLDVPECLWYVISYFIQRNIFTEDEIENVMNKMYIFLKQYNNNYRPIYHLESIFFYIINIIQSKNA